MSRGPLGVLRSHAVMEVIGLTGGIACGKSTVAKLLAARGVAIVDADVIAREITAVGTDGLGEIVREFGPEVLCADGTLDRKALGTRVFRDDAARNRLNEITHPRIAAESGRRLSALADQGHPFAIYEAALLLESGGWKHLGGLIVVTASPEAQRARLMARDGAGEDDARARIAAQWPLARKVAVATWVIDNGGTLDDLDARVAELHAALVVRHGAQASRAATVGE